MSWEVIKLPKCKHGAALYDQTGNGDWFHDEECTPGCLPVPSNPEMFSRDSYIEIVEDGFYIEHFECTHGECSVDLFGNRFCGLPGWEVYQRSVFAPHFCRVCGHGFEDDQDVKDLDADTELWQHVLCPGERS